MKSTLPIIAILFLVTTARGQSKKERREWVASQEQIAYKDIRFGTLKKDCIDILNVGDTINGLPYTFVPAFFKNEGELFGLSLESPAFPLDSIKQIKKYMYNLADAIGKKYGKYTYGTVIDENIERFAIDRYNIGFIFEVGKKNISVGITKTGPNSFVSSCHISLEGYKDYLYDIHRNDPPKASDPSKF